MLINTVNSLEVKKVFKVLFFSFLTFFTYLLLKDGTDSVFINKYFHFDFNISNFDKIVHIIIFLILSFLAEIAFSKKYQNLILLMAYGVLIEVFQGLFTETRTFDVFDMLADAIGIAAGWYVSQRKLIHNILKLKN